VITNPHVEEPIEWSWQGLRITGHPDLWWIAEFDDYRILYVKDYKLTNFAGKLPQLQGYAAILAERLAAEGLPIDRADVFFISLMDGLVSSDSYTPAQLQSFIGSLQQQLTNKTFRPGSHCRYCPLRYSCQPRQQWEADEVNAFLSEPFETIPEMAMSGRFSEAWDRIGFVSGIASRARAKAKGYLVEHGEIVSGDDRYTLGERVISRKVSITTTDGFLAVQGILGDQGMLRAIGELPLKSIEDEAISALKAENNGKPPRGSIGKKREEIQTVLAPVTTVKTSQIIEKESVTTIGVENGAE
jgi:hypothetical protein